MPKYNVAYYNNVQVLSSFTLLSLRVKEVREGLAFFWGVGDGGGGSYEFTFSPASQRKYCAFHPPSCLGKTQSGRGGKVNKRHPLYRRCLGKTDDERKGQNSMPASK